MIKFSSFKHQKNIYIEVIVEEYGTGKTKIAGFLYKFISHVSMNVVVKMHGARI